MAVMLWEVALLIVLVDVHLDVEIRVGARVKEAVKRIVLALAVMDVVRRVQAIAMEDPVPRIIIIVIHIMVEADPLIIAMDAATVEIEVA